MTIGSAVQRERQRRGWTRCELARRARLSAGTVSGVEAGRPSSLETYARLSSALGLGLEVSLADRRRNRPREPGDLVHAAMGELEAGWLQSRGYDVAIDHPYQHYQFAGRADVLAWTASPPALLHIENRTRFPDLQQVAGSYNAKRQYLAQTVARRLGLRRFGSETHLIAGLWSAEVIHSVRMRSSSFRALCPDDLDRFHAWLGGDPPASGVSSSFVLLDPFARGRQARTIDLGATIDRAKPRVRGYREAAERLQARSAR